MPGASEGRVNEESDRVCLGVWRGSAGRGGLSEGESDANFDECEDDLEGRDDGVRVGEVVVEAGPVTAKRL